MLSRASDLWSEFMHTKDTVEISSEESIEQIDMFNSSDFLVNELKAINLEKITPLEALNVLNKLKKKLK